MTSQSSQPKPAPGAPQNHESAPDHPAINGRKASVALIIVAIVVIGLALYGIWKRQHHDEVLAETTERDAAPTVIALPAKSGAPTDSFELPGNVTAWSDSPIYARTSGYLTKWYYDIGAHVKKGDLLAEISTPELDQQVAQAEADLVTAQTNAGNAKIQAERYKGLVASDAVSKQDTDTFVTQAASTASAVTSAQANVDRLKQMQSFEKLYAPFDGVITARNIDTGQLINQGAANELFHLQSLGTLRVYVNIPEVYTAAIKRGQKVALTFPQYPGRTIAGTYVRSADSIDPSNRTLLIEIDVDNRKGELMPGSLAQVHFKTQSAGQTYIVPAAALIFRSQGIRLGTVVNGNIAHLVPITIGQDNGATVEVIAGLGPNDRVIQDPPDSIIEGEKLNVESAASQSARQTPANPQPAQPNGGKQ
jgi:RND family efflux transporter MFP subunit